jgi:8-oxo-dGTP pyrophosphatase MutT (NUDIX family)
MLEPLPAASVIVLRDAPLEVLMIRRSAQASFVPDFWVFPGGMRDEADGGDLRVTAIRETREETGIVIDDPDQLVRTSRWITPLGVPKRFDTDFYLAKVPRDVVVTIDNAEVVDHVWITPADALKRLKMVFPTIKNLEALLGFDSADALIESRRGAVIEPVQPVLVNGKPVLR